MAIVVATIIIRIFLLTTITINAIITICHMSAHPSRFVASYGSPPKGFGGRVRLKPAPSFQCTPY
eukprot:266156-Pyramimonas_sp.AAC.1